MRRCKECNWQCCVDCEDRLQSSGAKYCPKRHELEARKAKGEGWNCGVCSEDLNKGDFMLYCEICSWVLCVGCLGSQSGGGILHRMKEEDLKEIIGDINGSCGDIFANVVEGTDVYEFTKDLDSKDGIKWEFQIKDQKVKNSRHRQSKIDSAPMKALEAQPMQDVKCGDMLRLIDPSREGQGDSLALFLAYLSDTSNDSLLVQTLDRCIIQTPGDIDSNLMRLAYEDFKPYHLLRSAGGNTGRAYKGSSSIFSVKTYNKNTETPP